MNKLNINIEVPLKSRIEKDMLTRKMNIGEYADYCNVSRDVISKLLNERGVVGCDSLYKIEQRTGLKLIPKIQITYTE